MSACPICKKPVDESKKEKYFPFCSERCKLIDLGRWLGGKYQIPVEENEEFRNPKSESNPNDE